MAGPLQFLRFNGVEVANAARPLSYLRRGLGSTRWEIGPGEPCGVLFRENGGTCVLPDVFVSPAIDPAPWYDATEPGSESFLGFVLLDLQGYDSTVARGSTQRLGGLGGGTLGAQYRKVRQWKFRGVMVSNDDLGAEFGLRWLKSVLEADTCDGCATTNLEVRLVCPPGDCTNDEVGHWVSYDVGLVDGPHEVEQWGPARNRNDSDVLAGCRDYVTVEFVVEAQNPWLYKQPLVCLPASDLVACGDACTDICTFLSGGSSAPCCNVSPPKRGVLGAIFTLRNDTSTPFGSIRLESRTTCGDTVPLLSITLSGIAAFSTVIVDSARHTITQVDDLGNVTDAQNLVVLTPGQTVEWIEVADCEPAACLCANPIGGAPGHTATVEIQMQQRES